MTISIFTDKNKPPPEAELKKSLGKMHSLWSDLKNYVIKNYTDAAEEWAYPGKSFGWNYRIFGIKGGKKRVIVYMMPLDRSFKVSLVYGAKATEEAMKSKISDEIKFLISSAKVYAEGRGFRIDVTNRKMLRDIKKLIDIKLSN